MTIFGTVRSIGEALGLWKSWAVPIGCSMGKVAIREVEALGPAGKPRPIK